MQSSSKVAPVILIHHIGAKSGIERVTPLACSPRGAGRFAVWAANGGSPAHPAWDHNLKANPTVTGEVGTRTFRVVAEELDGTARAQLWPKLVAQYPSLGEVQAKTTRQFPVFLLTRQDLPATLAAGCPDTSPPSYAIPRNSPRTRPAANAATPPRDGHSSPPRRLNEPPTQIGGSREDAVP
jgi:deazaflavin-dependent oxidoreductase (nitroreductase family)